MKKFLFQAYYTAIVEAVSYVSQCALKKDTRPILEAVNIRNHEGNNQLSLTSTDSAIALTANIDLATPQKVYEEVNINVDPKTFLNAMEYVAIEETSKKLLAVLTVDFSIDTDTKRLCATMGTREVQMPLIEGQYPLAFSFFEQLKGQCNKPLCMSLQVLSNIVNAMKKAKVETIQFDLRDDGNALKPFRARLNDGKGDLIVTPCRPFED